MTSIHETAICILSDAFGLTADELKSLDGSTSLEVLYNRFPHRFGDSMEFETLQLELECELGRELTEEECQKTKTILDVEILLASGQSS